MHDLFQNVPVATESAYKWMGRCNLLYGLLIWMLILGVEPAKAIGIGALVFVGTLLDYKFISKDIVASPNQPEFVAPLIMLVRGLCAAGLLMDEPAAATSA